MSNVKKYGRTHQHVFACWYAGAVPVRGAGYGLKLKKDNIYLEHV